METEQRATDKEWTTAICMNCGVIQHDQLDAICTTCHRAELLSPSDLRAMFVPTDSAKHAAVFEIGANYLRSQHLKNNAPIGKFVQKVISEATQPLVDALIKIANDSHCDRCQVAVDALAKVKEGS